MTRRILGLNEMTQSSGDEIPDGLFLVRVSKFEYRWHAHKPFYTLRLSVLEPRKLAGRTISGRLYCTPKALWKLGWFLRDFVHDVDLLARDEIDEKAMLGLCGIVKISRTIINGASHVNFDGFAPASQWKEFSTPPQSRSSRSELAK
jgi:hypothetical protein